MNEGKDPKSELGVPPIALADPRAVEMLRVWAVPGAPQQFVLKTLYEDPAAWGLLLVDVARHAAKAYEREGRDRSETLERIVETFEAEMESPTDEPLDITDDA